MLQLSSLWGTVEDVILDHICVVLLVVISAKTVRLKNLQGGWEKALLSFSSTLRSQIIYVSSCTFETVNFFGTFRKIEESRHQEAFPLEKSNFPFRKYLVEWFFYQPEWDVDIWRVHLQSFRGEELDNEKISLENAQHTCPWWWIPWFNFSSKRQWKQLSKWNSNNINQHPWVNCIRCQVEQVTSGKVIFV